MNSLTDMARVQLASFVSTEEEVFASILAAKSLQHLQLDHVEPIILIPRTLLEEFEAKYTGFRLKPIYNKLGAKLETAFSKGYNWNLGFRPALSKIFERAGEDKGVLYFSPRMIFFDADIFAELGDASWAARQPDDFWPENELYGPSLTEIWGNVVELGGGQIEDWIDAEMPEGYWRRYPAASPALFFASDTAAFDAAYGEINDALIADPPKALSGQGHAPAEASLTATIVKLGGRIIDPRWDFSVRYYQDFYDLILRMSDEQWDWFFASILEDRAVRPLFKSVDEYKLIFYQSRILSLRAKLDSIERNFSILRMQQLIDRRNTRKSVRKHLNQTTPLPLV